MEVESFFQTCFSVGVAAFLLGRMEKELRALRDAIQNLRHCQTCTLSPWARELEELIEAEAEEKA